ncbi:hypothetical protein [Candidatus Carsonella ruddii]|uniref:hypothetical protein n=1 Tax=Carsonella ruddii TaxID=114186 RepID=UPI003D9A7ABD
MTKIFFIKNKIKKIFHFENNCLNNNLSIGNNFCWQYIHFFKRKILIMSVLPGFGNQKFLNKTKDILLIKKNIDGGINYKIFKLIKNYFNKIIIGSSIINIKIIKSFFNYNFVNNEYLI